MIGLGSLADRSRGNDASGIGVVVLLLGMVLSFGELYATRFFQDVRAAIFGTPASRENPADHSAPTT